MADDKVVRLVHQQSEPQPPHADRWLAALIILTQSGSRAVAAGFQVALYLLAAIGVVSLLGR